MRGRVAVAAVAAALVACSGPPAAAPGASPAPSAGPAPSPASGPRRPRDVRIDGVDPCSLLTPAQRARLGLDLPPQHLDGKPDGDGALCSWSGEEPRAVAAGVTTLIKGGIERYDTGSGATTTSPITVRGYPALLVRLNGHPEYCAVGIDVAAGQALDVNLTDGGRRPPIPQEQLCGGARQVADIVVGNLLARD